ncbi:hypothetical protein LTR37_001765 [Vermiconidia calcicola]|uniref:Uncharacterized protein n=1 Tax=Vermiconidia calcicola TaxID=1690605 RepID=A0ACC3NV12_9PEZI|nr:hypothetical protein LTR37_001765 [Vermiconidia calcicola]
MYTSSGPVDASVESKAGSVKGRTALVTGGASGLGEAYVRALVKAGAHVVIADRDEQAGSKLQNELSDSTTFVRCDVLSWKEQLAAFKKAIEVTGSIDIVMANAGIATNDQVFYNDISRDEPEEPDLPVLKVNIIGVVLTAKLAMWYFEKQNAGENKRDRCLILKSSMAGYLDLHGAPQYSCSKFAVRGFMRALRQQAALGNQIRVNLIAPWYVKTPILSGAMDTFITKSGAGFAKAADAAAALLCIVSNDSIQGRALAIVPRDWEGASNGYVDLNQDDFEDSPWMHRAQEYALKPAKYAMTSTDSEGNPLKTAPRQD